MNGICFCPCAMSTYYNQMQATFQQPQQTMSNTDLTNLYSKEELKTITDKFGGRLNPMSEKNPNLEIYFHANGEAIIINNRNCTNCTIEIEKDGTATHTGSWNIEKLKENYSDIYQDAIKRMQKPKFNSYEPTKRFI